MCLWWCRFPRSSVFTESRKVCGEHTHHLAKPSKGANRKKAAPFGMLMICRWKWKSFNDEQSKKWWWKKWSVHPGRGWRKDSDNFQEKIGINVNLSAHVLNGWIDEIRAKKNLAARNHRCRFMLQATVHVCERMSVNVIRNNSSK